MKTMAVIMVAMLFIANSQATLPDNYNSLKASDKSEALFHEIMASEYKELPNEIPFAQMWKLLSSRFLSVTLTHNTDELPEGRIKLIHSFGSVAKVQFIANKNSPYTGIFASGGEGVMRSSLAHSFESYTPGFGLKILIDGKESLNIFAMDSLDGQGEDRNYFSRPFKTSIDAPKAAFLKILAQAFEKAVHRVNKHGSAIHLPLKHLAKYRGNGEVEFNPKAPYMLVFKPLIKGFDSNSKSDLREELKGIPVGTVLYEVYAKKTSTSELQSIGKVVTTSSFVASEYGDCKLFFKHQVD